MAEELAGRHAELTVLAELIGQAPVRGNALVLRGDPGIGKTSLLRAATARARQAGFTVLETAGVETEALLPYAGLSVAAPGAEQRGCPAGAAAARPAGGFRRGRRGIT
jgi:hypothetical protein